MKSRLIPLVLALTPVAAFAQTTYSRAEIVPPRLVVCSQENGQLWDRKAALDQDQRAIDRERDGIEREAAALAAEMRALNSSDLPAVAAYNAHSAAHNERVAAHNRYVNATNRAAALLNGDSADFLAYCNTLRYSQR
jgi:D-serine deaminase-like pyridoxal phosphate-dependent protein